MELTVDKDILRNTLKELVEKEPVFVDVLLKEITADLKKKKLAEIVNEDFSEYNEVFKRLA